MNILSKITKPFKPIRACAWFSDAHTDITLKAVSLLEKEGRIRQYNFYKDHIDEIAKGAVEPDHDGDCDKGTGAHYYSCCDPKGRKLKEENGYYRNHLNDFSKSARTMLEDNYTAALCLYKSGNTKRAMHVLGRALHFAEDMSCTVHTSNIKYFKKRSNVHYAYEKHADTICRQHTAMHMDKRLINDFSGEDLEKPLNKLIKRSAEYVQTISRLDPKAFDEAAAETLPLAQQNCAALLIKFYNDCTRAADCPCGGEKYAIRNCMTGLLITITSKGVTADTSSKEKEQKLLFGINDLGAFSLRAADGGYISKTAKKLDYLTDKGTPEYFRFAQPQKGKFRISVGSTGFEKVLACTKGGALAVTDFAPGDISQLWTIG